MSTYPLLPTAKLWAASERDPEIVGCGCKEISTFPDTSVLGVDRMKATAYS